MLFFNAITVLLLVLVLLGLMMRIIVRGVGVWNVGVDHSRWEERSNCLG